MLFSKEEIAAYINENFEPVWVSVRPVPIIKVDFGNGNVLTRTLHGNIATYACDSYGKVLDVLPGIYTPEQYQTGLGQLSLLWQYVRRADGTTVAAKLEDYHRRQATRLSQGKSPVQLAEAMTDMSKARIEGGSKRIIMITNDLPFGSLRARTDIANASRAATVEAMDSASARAGGKAFESSSSAGGKAVTVDQLVNALRKDTALNESDRRLLIHQKLLADGQVRPEIIVKWLYREVLHADLDDPYLGLGPVLFAAYPFKDEDKGVR